MKTKRILAIMKWILLGPVLALLLLNHSFGDERKAPPSGEPAQKWSRVHYDPMLTDSFFELDEWSQGNRGQVVTSMGMPEDDPPWWRHTAKCFSTSFGTKHLVRLCEAALHGANSMELVIHDTTPAFNDRLTVRIRNGMFMCQYRAAYLERRIALATRWTTTLQKLILDKKAYSRGDLIKGRVVFECLEELSDPKHGEEPSGVITVKGVIKTVLK